MGSSVPRRRFAEKPTKPSSNKTFNEWVQVFGDEVLATAILDRLLHHCEVISINGPCYQLKNRLKTIERENGVA
ncbi:ATP-binding protein [Streptomyces zaomyceticus]|uniref:ATP-binding protein n=1 Tax=Streptomyces zaomyceticus TaxID=68286 RepID=UPI00369281BC